MKSADEVECVVHGTYYSYWPKILQKGLVKPSPHSHIPCYPFVPLNTGGPRSYQLFVFINTWQAMRDGIKFFTSGERQVLCSGDAQGCLLPKYFSRVVDTETRAVIYPNPQGQGVSGPPPTKTPPGLGRGAPISAVQKSHSGVYNDIWSQVQRLDADMVNLRPFQGQTTQLRASPGRMEVSVDDIFRGAANHTRHPQPHPNLPQNPQSQGEPNIMSLLTAAHQSYALSNSTAATTTPTTTTTTPHKNGSPTKSAFVPTQVIRNQTPRKPKPNGQERTHSNKAEGGANANPQQHHQHHQQQQRKDNQNSSHQHQQKQTQGSEGAARPRRQVRNRLAVRFPGKKD
ncbi:tRNA 2'-phosphotransferase 1 [Portunus trituberculatus]|uniref:tRNA 2'-phosphotransferase 1 n=2 Tax=Portunus trituberculatus TaxID=210409 RepID=A0A5B7GBS0_PORTR|nr:tRNA 2'-phosphotransferase 1 [Portunus trituberculatus]